MSFVHELLPIPMKQTFSSSELLENLNEMCPYYMCVYIYIYICVCVYIYIYVCTDFKSSNTLCYVYLYCKGWEYLDIIHEVLFSIVFTPSLTHSYYNAFIWTSFSYYFNSTFWLWCIYGKINIVNDYSWHLNTLTLYIQVYNF